MKRIVLPGIGVLFLGTVFVVALLWFTFRVYVPPNMCAVMIRKTGDPLPNGQLVATEPGQMGIQEKVLGPGRYFFNPYRWDHELHPLTVVPSGNPTTWEWVHSLSDDQRDALRSGQFKFKGEFPRVGVVTRKVGDVPGPGQVIVPRDSELQGILAEVLTPGTYKVNPYVYEVDLHPAVMIPAGFVGVVTNLFGTHADKVIADATIGTDAEILPSGRKTDEGAGDVPPDEGSSDPISTHGRPLAAPGQRGIVRDVLQPGLYFINPKLQKVTLVEIGFNEYSQVKVSEAENYRITFPSDTGYTISVDVTVIWGIHPQNAAQIINEFGNIDRVLDKVIGPQLRSICRNIGSTYAARDFIQGEKREQFQQAMTAELQRVARGKNLEVLIVLVRDIEVLAPAAAPGEGAVTEDLKRTIQESFIAIERQITNDKKREAATVKAKLEEERKKIEIARETIRAQTRVLVANVLAEGEKKAAEIDAQADLDVAGIQQEVAKLEAQRIEILGQARADVEKLRNDAEAQGYEMLVGALGSGHAYNLYTFAEKFEPKDIRLFFAGEGTFWTDLTRLEEMGAARVLGAPASTPASKAVADQPSP